MCVCVCVCVTPSHIKSGLQLSPDSKVSLEKKSELLLCHHLQDRTLHTYFMKTLTWSLVNNRQVWWLLLHVGIILSP